MCVCTRRLAAHRPLVAALWLCSCAGGDAQFEVKQASDVPNTPLVVSFLGAYDGKMNEVAGTTFARDVSRLLAAEPCVAGFNEQLRAANPEASSALEAQAESTGVDDELLRMIAPAATGDVILALELSGRLMMSEDEPSPPSPSSKPAAPAPNRTSAPRGRGSRHARGAPRSAPPSTVARVVPDLVVSAAFFSVRLERTVSLVTMRYSGSSVEDGLLRLAEELATVFPNAVCRPWNWGHVRVVHEQDSAGLALPRFHLVRTD